MTSQVHVFNVAMTCEGCANAVRRILGKQGDKVSNVDVNVEAKEVKVTSTIDKDELLQIVSKCGKETSYVRTE